jgi:Flp pilus assembly protein TadD
LDAGNAAGAASMLERAVRRTPEDVEARALLGAALLQAGRPAAAQPHLLDALRRAPRHHQAAYDLGMALERQGHVQEAVKAFRLAWAARPGHRETAKALARHGITVQPATRLPTAPTLVHHGVSTPTVVSAHARALPRTRMAAPARRPHPYPSSAGGKAVLFVLWAVVLLFMLGVFAALLPHLLQASTAGA